MKNQYTVIVTVGKKFDTLQEPSGRLTPNGKYENNIETTDEYMPTKSQKLQISN